MFVKCGLAIEINSKDFIPSTKLASKRFTANASRRRHLHRAMIQPTTVSYLRQILFSWFGSETPFTAQLQSSFVRTLVTHLGPGVLLIPDIWEHYSHLPRWLFTDECPAPFNANTSPDVVFKPMYMEPFVSRLSSGPVLSEARMQAHHLQDAYM